MKLKLTITAVFEVKPEYYNPGTDTSDILSIERKSLNDEGELNYLGVLTDNSVVTSTLEEVKE